MVGKSDLEESFLLLFRAECQRNNIRLPYPEREYRFHPTRKWRFDFAWPELQVAVEIDGGGWTGGRHSTGAGMAQDCDKRNAATARGWKVLRFQGTHLRSPDAVFALLLETMGAIETED